MVSAHGRSYESEDTRGLDDDQGDEGAAMKSARSGASAFGIVASAAIVSSGIAGSLLGGTAAQASTVSVAAPNVCGQPPAATSAARTVPAGHTAVVLDVASLPMSNTPKTKKSSSSASPSASTSTSATAKASANAP